MLPNTGRRGRDLSSDTEALLWATEQAVPFAFSRQGSVFLQLTDDCGDVLLCCGDVF